MSSYSYYVDCTITMYSMYILYVIYVAADGNALASVGGRCE